MILGLATVGPLRRAGDVDHHPEAVPARLGDELIEIAEVVGRVIRVACRGRPGRCDLGPVRGRVDDRGAGGCCRRKVLGPVGGPAKTRVVEEADRHLRRCADCCGRDGDEGNKRDERQTDASLHGENLPVLGHLSGSANVASGFVGRVRAETLSSFHGVASSTGCAGRCEARTQGVPIAVSYRDDRGRSIAPPSAAGRHLLHSVRGSQRTT